MGNTKRVLAVDPSTKGFGWIVFEGPDRIIDWGIAYVRPISNARCLKRLAAILDHYPPDVFVTEDLPLRGSRRSRRGQQLIVSMERMVRERGHDVRLISLGAVRRSFAERGAWNKAQIARAIAIEHPELAPWLPPVRKIWMSEDHRSSIFDAAALAHTFFHRPTRGRRRARGGFERAA